MILKTANFLEIVHCDFSEKLQGLMEKGLQLMVKI